MVRRLDAGFGRLGEPDGLGPSFSGTPGKEVVR
jgi:hypothetical protein